jgi:prefoldin subunit 5
MTSDFQNMARQRLNELKQELAAGQEQMTHLQARLDELKQTCLRISGAIQVLEELENNAAAPAQPAQPANPAS